MELSNFEWREQQGRFAGPEEIPWHEWAFTHASGRVVALVHGPTDKTGGFTHAVNFLFSPEVTMQGGPFIFIDFDSAKTFIESRVSAVLLEASPEGAFTLDTSQTEPSPFEKGMKEAMGQFAPFLSRQKVQDIEP